MWNFNQSAALHAQHAALVHQLAYQRQRELILGEISFMQAQRSTSAQVYQVEFVQDVNNRGCFFKPNKNVLNVHHENQSYGHQGYTHYVPHGVQTQNEIGSEKKSKEINNEIEKIIMENTLWGYVHEEWLCIGENNVSPLIDEPMCDFTLKALWREV